MTSGLTRLPQCALSSSKRLPFDRRRPELVEGLRAHHSQPGRPSCCACFLTSWS